MLNLATKFKPKAEAFSMAQAAGFESAELWLDEKYLRNHDRIVHLAQQSAMSFALHFPNRGDLDLRVLENAVDLYRRLECSAMVIHAPMLAAYGELLLAIDPMIRLATENHRLKPSQFLRWADENRWLTLDVEHLWKFTLKDAPLSALLESINDFLRRYAHKLIHIHMPGYLPGGGEHRPMYCSREMVQGVLTRLDTTGYENLIVSEVNKEFQNLYELSMDMLLFQHWNHSRDQRVTAPRLDPRVA